MMSRYLYKSITWIDLESPSHSEIQSIANEFDIEPRVAEELIIPSSHPRAEFIRNYCYLVLHFPILNNGHRSHEAEVDFIISDKFLITTHYEVVDHLHKFAKAFDIQGSLESPIIKESGGHTFFAMVRTLYRSIDHEIDFIRRDLLAIEDRIFSGEEYAMVREISKASRALLNVRQSIEPHREVLRTLSSESVSRFTTDISLEFRHLEDEYYRLHNHIMRLTEWLHELRETNRSSLSTKQNETMKIFTIMAFHTFPLTLIVSIFGMGAESTPIMGIKGDFWMIMAILIIFTGGMMLYFKSKKWL